MEDLLMWWNDGCGVPDSGEIPTKRRTPDAN